MSFSVEDFHDPVRLLDQHPEWRAELRRLVLTEELLGLPADVAELRQIVAELAAAQRQWAFELRELRQSIVELRQIVAGHTHELAELRQSIVELRQIVAGLVEAQQQTAAQLADLRRIVEDHTVELRAMPVEIGSLQGDSPERRYREHASAYFDEVMRRPRLLSQQRLADLLDAAEDAGQLTSEERRDVLRADVVVRGRRRSDDAEAYLVVEVSVGIGVSDVQRAIRRASLLGRLAPTLAAVAGERITADAAASAAEQGAWRVLDGQVDPPRAG